MGGIGLEGVVERAFGLSVREMEGVERSGGFELWMSTAGWGGFRYRDESGSMPN